MPKKSKKDKLLAELRREREKSTDLNILKSSNSSKPETIQIPSRNITYRINTDVLSLQNKTLPNDDLTDFSGVRKDLLRTVILAGIALASVFLLAYKI